MGNIGSHVDITASSAGTSSKYDVQKGETRCGSRLILPLASRSQVVHFVDPAFRVWAPTERLFPTVLFERATERPPYVRFEPDYAEGRAAVSSRAASRILIPFLSVTMPERVRLQ